MGILEVLRRELHGPVHFTIRNSDRVLSCESVVVVVAVGLEVGWVVAVRIQTIDLDGGVLFALDFPIFTLEFVEWDLVGDEGDGVAVPVTPTVVWRENPDFRSEAVLARNEACPCPAIVAIPLTHLDVDRLRLWVGHGCDGVVLALAIVEDLPLHLDLYLVLDELDTSPCSCLNFRHGIFIPIGGVRTMRVPVLLKVEHSDESGLLDLHQFGLEFLNGPERLLFLAVILIFSFLGLVAIVDYLLCWLHILFFLNRLHLFFLNRTTRFFFLDIVIVVVTAFLNLLDLDGHRLLDHRLLDHNHRLWFWDDNFLLFLIARLQSCNFIPQPLVLDYKFCDELISLIFFCTKTLEFSTTSSQFLLKFGDLLQ